jgi:predicted secreted hydrolase
MNKARWIVLLLWCWGHLLAMEEWAPAPNPPRLAFPKDHGSHPQQKIEWWYFTGNLSDEAGKGYGYQLTFFRIGVDPKPVNPSAWTVRDLHMAHFAVTDLATGRYYSAQRLERAGPGLSGAAQDQLHVWNGTWSAKMNEEGSIQLQAATYGKAEDFALELDLRAARPMLLHGEQGYSRKGVQPGNASIYYSYTRLASTGKLRIGSQERKVSGQSWMDHEYGTSFLEPGQTGWDWFSLQLSDGSDLMLFQIRQANPAVPPMLSGTLLEPDGSVVSLGPQDFKLTSSQPWKSPHTGANYPLKWELAIPKSQLELTVTTTVSDQEMRGEQAGPSYWEGAVQASGMRLGKSITGKGYLEMTGYTGGSMRQFFKVGE